MDPASAATSVEVWPLTWWAGALIVLSATAIVAAYIRHRGAGWRFVLVGAAGAIVVGAIMGWRLWGDPWLGGTAGITGACSPWIPAMVKATLGKYVGRGSS